VCSKANARDAGAADGGGKNVASCTEQPQQLHAGKWSVNVTLSGRKYEATLDKGAGSTETFACTSSARSDAGARDGGGGDGGAAVPTYAEVAPIIQATCGGCHGATFDSLAKVKQQKAQMLGAVSVGFMPRGNGNFRNTPDGEKLLDFLRNSSEL
jgi:hypothetical protein